MSNIHFLSGKKILAVDDEPDILMVLKDLLSMCDVTTASSFEEARDILKSRDFDAAILDIMGVDGLKLLEKAVDRGIPSVMLTAHALSAETLLTSIRLGAISYLPKEKLAELEERITSIELTLRKKGLD